MANQIAEKQKLLINTISRPPAHRCSQCGKPYYRRNMMEAWTIRNPGKRIGWHKDIVKVCLACMDQRQAQGIIEIADVQFSRKEVVRKK